MSDMEIVLSTDSNYIMPTGILMCSICEHNSDVHFYIICYCDVRNEDIEKLKGIADGYSADIDFYSIDESLLKNLPFGRKYQPCHVTICAYSRLFLTVILPDTINKVLYLDGDTICRSSLVDLWNTDISQYPIAAAVDMDANDESRYTKLGYDISLGYFNSGVLLINLEYWRNNNVLASFIQFVNDYPDRIVFHDQDILNYVFRGQILSIPIKYNLQNGFILSHPTYLPESENIFISTIRNPSIVHYTTNIKPWVKGCSHPFTRDFLYYKSLSPWKKCRLPLKKVNTFRGHLINVLVWLGLHKYNGDYTPLLK